MIPMLVEAAARSLALGLILWLVLVVTRSRNPNLQKTAWTTVLLAALAMPILMRTSVVPPVIQTPVYLVVLQGHSGTAAPMGHAANGIAVLYSLTALALLCRFAANMLWMWRIRRNARVLNESWTSGLNVRVSTRLPGPATFGSTVILPEEFANWGARKLTAVLAHERSHVRHGDCYVLWLSKLHTSLFWFNPLAWWMQRRLAMLSEITSDEAAAAALGDPPAYAEILLEFAQQRSASIAATAMARPDISSRIERILSGIAPSPVPNLSRRALLVTALLPAIAAAASPLQSSSEASAASAPNAGPPRVTSFPDLKQYYPPEAEHRGIEGLVDIQVTLDAQGRATDTLILSEDPLDMGFGAAASTVAHVTEYTNPTGRPTQFRLRVKFALHHPPAPGTPNVGEPSPH